MYIYAKLCVLWQAGGSTGLLMDLAANEKAVHSDFFNGKIVIYTGLNILLKHCSEFQPNISRAIMSVMVFHPIFKATQK